jgi:amino acid permease
MIHCLHRIVIINNKLFGLSMTSVGPCISMHICCVEKMICILKILLLRKRKVRAFVSHSKQCHIHPPRGA